MSADTLFVLLSETGQSESDFSVELAYFIPGTGGDFSTNFTQYSLSLDSYLGLPVFLAFVYANWSGDCAVLLDSVNGPPVLLPSPPYNPQPTYNASGVDFAFDI